MVFTLCTSEAIVRKAGYGVNSTAAASSALLSDFCSEAEAWVCAKTRYNWVLNYSSVVDAFKGVLADVTSDIAAMKLVSYDTRGYSKLAEAQTILNVLRDNSNLIIADIKEGKFQEVINGSA